jgi:formyltetrahydrofolate synthetase
MNASEVTYLDELDLSFFATVFNSYVNSFRWQKGANLSVQLVLQVMDDLDWINGHFVLVYDGQQAIEPKVLHVQET